LPKREKQRDEISCGGFLILIAMGLATLSGPASARTAHPAIGGSGDRSVRDECDAGHYMIGVVARIGSWWDQIRSFALSRRQTGSDPPTSLTRRAAEKAAWWGNAAKAEADAAAARQAFAEQRAEEIKVTGKTFAECQQSNAMCESRVMGTVGPINALGAIVTECSPFFQQCMGNAAADLAAANTGAAAPGPAPAGEGPQTTSVCGLAGGAATVVISDPAVTTLNVRDRPNGAILTEIPQGSQVDVVGGCGVRIAAGIVAQKPGAGGGQPPIPGWCAISSPLVGCVSEQFLATGTPAGGQARAAGIVASRPKPAHSGAPPVGFDGLTARVRRDANIRNLPSSNGTKVIGKLPRGTLVTTVERTSQWCRLAMPGPVDGWVFRDLLEFDDFGPVAAEPMPMEQIPAGDGQQTTSSCGVPGGTATVLVPDPNVTTLNVRDRPNGTILTQIPEGSQVNVVGGCGARIAAGIVAQKPGAGGGQPSVPGWCAISSPLVGCVSERFLIAGIPTGAQTPAAGIVASRPIAEGNFTGTWNAIAQESDYTMMHKHNSNSVDGSYTGGDGSSGRIKGTVQGNVLRFSWQQADGLGGMGKFALSKDANSFRGSFTLGNDPDVVDGSWDGRRLQ
jgi:hypothetical protein